MRMFLSWAGSVAGNRVGMAQDGEDMRRIFALAPSLFCEAKSVSCCPLVRVMSKACSVSPLNLKPWFEVPHLYILLWRSAFHKERTVFFSYWLCPSKTGVFPIKDVDLLNGGWTPAEFCLPYANIKKGGTIVVTAEPFFFWLAKKLHGYKDPGSSLIAVKAMKKVWGCHAFYTALNMQFTSPWFSIIFCRLHTVSPLYVGQLLLILPSPEDPGSQKLHATICLCSVFAEQATTAHLSHELLWPQGLLAGASARKSWDTNSSALDFVPSDDSFFAKRQQLLSLLTGLTQDLHLSTRGKPFWPCQLL